MNGTELEIYYDEIIEQWFIPTGKNKFGDVRHTGQALRNVQHLKKGDYFETWLTPDSFKVVKITLPPSPEQTTGGHICGENYPIIN